MRYYFKKVAILLVNIVAFFHAYKTVCVRLKLMNAPIRPSSKFLFKCLLPCSCFQ